LDFFFSSLLVEKSGFSVNGSHRNNRSSKVTTDVLLRCPTNGIRGRIAEKRVPLDAVEVSVSLRRLHRRRVSCSRLQLAGMGVAELPRELFLVTTLKQLRLFNNHLCSLPSTVAQLSLLELLNVRANRRDSCTSV
jgi:hypothetical protein